ncbi:MAG TPA: substrate-binding domain-containing protein [Terriglobales bacterium]|nr:substrate-binding domain-containing protein [Terriglobales bacterium]
MTRGRYSLMWALVAGFSVMAAAQQAPPWSQGRNNPAADKGFVFQVDDVDNVPDLHGNPEGAQLVLFIGGNQFMVLPELIEGFERQHPELRGRIFYETLPPGILRRQMEHKGILTLGNLTLQVHADVYEAGARVLAQMEQEGQVEKPVHYASNQLEIMVHAGNPRGIRSLKDLGNGQLRLSMPNPAWEGVARQIEDSLRKAGGEELVRKVMDAKVKSGTTFLTHIHHRQTPMRIMNGKSDAGVTWSSEVRFQEKIGNPISGVDIPAEQNTTALYAAAALRNAPHAASARAWVSYLNSEQAQAIYRKFGFGPGEAATGGKQQ